MTDLTPRPAPAPGAMGRLKRSRSLQITTLMASASISLTACGAPPGVQASRDEVRPAPALAYTSLAECKSADDISDADCDTNYQQAAADAEKTAPRYATREECEGEWGPSQCQTTQRDGGSFFTPLLAGFVIGQVLGGGRGFGGGPLYRDRDNRYSNGYGGGGVYTDYRTGRQVTDARAHTPAARQAPPRAQTRTTVVSRGGFGGGGRSFSG